MPLERQNTNSVVLVVGDVMIDRTWTVTEHAGETVQMHGDVRPRRRVRPEDRSEQLGGAGSTASALWALGNAVHVLGAWNERDQALLAGLRPPDATDSGPCSFRLHRLDTASAATTIKFRVFVLHGAGGSPHLEYRFDQDPASGPKADHSTLPADLPERLNAIVLMDFQKGLVTSDLIDQLLDHYPEVPWFVDSKSPHLTELIQPVATNNRLHVVALNRDELLRLLTPDLYPAPNVSLVPTGRAQDLPILSRELDSAICTTLAQVNKDVGALLLVAKLDRDGVAATDNERFYRSCATEQLDTAVGLSAGDIFMAQLTTDYVNEISSVGSPSVPQPDRIASILWRAQRSAEGWLTFFERESRHRDTPLLHEYLLGELHASYTSDAQASAIPQASPQGPARNTVNIARPKDVLNVCQHLFDSEAILTGPKLNVDDARHVLAGLVSADLNFRSMVRVFAGRVISYWNQKNASRPFSCQIKADPGSGKSFFAHQLAVQLKMQLHEINVSQMATRSNLLNAIAEIGDHPSDRPMLLVDEADSEIDGHVFSLLLAPMWDSTIRVGPYLRHLPHHMVMLFITSKDEKKLGRAEKYRDFQSRLSAPPLTLHTLESADLIFLAGDMIRHYHPSVSQVELGLFNIILEAQKKAVKINIRELERFIQQMTTPVDGIVRLSSFRTSQLPTGLPIDSWYAANGDTQLTLADRDAKA